MCLMNNICVLLLLLFMKKDIKWHCHIKKDVSGALYCACLQIFFITVMWSTAVDRHFILPFGTDCWRWLLGVCAVGIERERNRCRRRQMKDADDDDWQFWGRRDDLATLGRCRRRQTGRYGARWPPSVRPSVHRIPPPAIQSAAGSLAPSPGNTTAAAAVAAARPMRWSGRR